MHDLLLNKIRKKVDLSEEDEKIIIENLQFRKLKKRQFILHEGAVCKEIIFVNSGILRLYSINANGKEHILQFAVEGWLIADLYSFISNTPSAYCIDVLESSDVVWITHAAWHKILNTVPAFEIFTRMELLGAYAAAQRRITSLISLSPQERYLQFLDAYPGIPLQVPQHMVASYLGLEPETISRVKKQLSIKK